MLKQRERERERERVDEDISAVDRTSSLWSCLLGPRQL